MAARVAMLQMQKDGLIDLPPVAERYRSCFVNRPLKDLELPPLEPLCGTVRNLSFEINVVSKAESRLWNAYVDQYHYLGYTKLGGAQLRYIVRAKDRPVAFFGFSAAAWKVKSRDEFIGWTNEQKEKNLHLVVNNSRFLILPKIEIPHLASHLLARMAKRLPADWYRTYSYKPLLLETFVQRDRFKGTCYRAANWIYLGDTKGRGKFDVNHRNATPVKSIWVYPLGNFNRSMKV